MKLLLTITILFLYTTTTTTTALSENAITNLKSKQSMLRNIASYSEKNGELTCSDDINEILYFLKIGQEYIERTHVHDIVVVIGPSRVGKSTLTQFVANETNQLRAECDEWEDECWIINDSGTIGGSLISRTFLPNLVFHESTETPFYDMPGFNDNRNDSIEIANSFFMQQILNDADRIKILVLARYSSFDISARMDFQNLLMNLVDLIKSPAKFRGGVAIVSTMAPVQVSHDTIIRRNTRFLKEDLLNNISKIFVGREEYITGSKEMLENILDSDTGNYFDAKYYSYFLAASIRGYLIDDPFLFDNKKFLKEVIWDRMKFVSTDDDDFGLPMSSAALRKLEITGTCICNALVTQMQIFAGELENYLLANIMNVIDGKDADIIHVSELLTNLIESNFSFEDMSGEPLSVYLQRMLDEVINLQIPSLNETLQQIEDTMSFIKFIKLTKAEIQFDPITWVINILSVEETLIKQLTSQAETLQDAAVSSLMKEAEIIAGLILTSVDALKDISQKEDVILVEVIRIEKMFERINATKGAANRLTQFLIFYLSEFDNLKDCRNCSNLPQLDALAVLEILDQFSWTKRDWTSSSESKLLKVLELERDFTIFLRAMFNDLSQNNVQTGDDLPIHAWWNSRKRLDEDNFDDFYATISPQGFNSFGMFDRSRVKEFVFQRKEGSIRLASLLNPMLENLYDCGNSTEVVIKGQIIAFDRLMTRCVNRQQFTRNRIVLIATVKIIANVKIIGREINASNNIDVILMSPEIMATNHSEIDLSGTANKQQGEQGKPAGTQYSLVQNIYAMNDGTISCAITFPKLTGGNGVDGAAGGEGAEGSKGDSANHFGVNVNSYCAAWLGGYIQIRGFNERNSCNTCTTSGKPTDPYCYCVAGSNGVVIRITGTSGYKGNPGKNGADGSCGGAGGQSYFVDANYFQFPKTATNGLQGKAGVGGPGGPGGRGGLYGDTMTVIIVELGSFTRSCGERSRSFQSSNLRGPSGDIGPAGKTCTSQLPIKSANKTVVTNHFESFKAALLSSTEFIFAHATRFLRLLGDAQPLD